MAAGGEGQARRDPRSCTPARRIRFESPATTIDDRDDAGPLLIGGAVAASALSLAGAWLAWRRRTSPMARAIRAAHSMRRIPGGGA